MTSVTFEEANLKIAEHQDEYETLHAHHNPKEGSITFCFQLNKEELDEIARTGRIYFKQLTFNQPMQPIAMSTEKSDLI
jgi:hypothetical protein